MLARPMSGLVAFLHAHSQASLQMALQNSAPFAARMTSIVGETAEDGLVMADGTIREIKIDLVVGCEIVF
jgi:hypothetical protein